MKKVKLEQSWKANQCYSRNEDLNNEKGFLNGFQADTIQLY